MSVATGQIAHDVCTVAPRVYREVVTTGSFTSFRGFWALPRSTNLGWHAGSRHALRLQELITSRRCFTHIPASVVTDP